jgi:hypothetical protein
VWEASISGRRHWQPIGQVLGVESDVVKRDGKTPKHHGRGSDGGEEKINRTDLIRQELSYQIDRSSPIQSHVVSKNHDSFHRKPMSAAVIDVKYAAADVIATNSFTSEPH